MMRQQVQIFGELPELVAEWLEGVPYLVIAMIVFGAFLDLLTPRRARPAAAPV